MGIDKFFDWIMDFLYDLASLVLMLLPNSPFNTDGFVSGLMKFEKIMANINYFIPFNDMFLIMGIYLGAVIIWMASRWLLRFAKYIN